MGDNFSETLNYLATKKGRLMGVLVGILLGFAIMKYGFWKTLFIMICAGLGYFIGKRIDDQRGFEDILEQVLPRGRGPRR